MPSVLSRWLICIMMIGCFVQQRWFVEKMKASVTVINQGSENGININFYAYELLSSRTWSYRTPKFFYAYVGAYDIQKAPSLVIKFGQFIWYYKRKGFIKKFCKKCGLETSSRSFLFLKNPLYKIVLGSLHTDFNIFR